MKEHFKLLKGLKYCKNHIECKTEHLNEKFKHLEYPLSYFHVANDGYYNLAEALGFENVVTFNKWKKRV